MDFEEFCSQFPFPAWSFLYPSAHGKQSGAVPPYPTAQLAHAEEFVCETVEVPFAQGVHSAAPEVSENVSTGQGEHGCGPNVSL